MRRRMIRRLAGNWLYLVARTNKGFFSPLLRPPPPYWRVDLRFHFGYFWGFGVFVGSLLGGVFFGAVFFVFCWCRFWFGVVGFVGVWRRLFGLFFFGRWFRFYRRAYCILVAAIKSRPKKVGCEKSSGEKKTESQKLGRKRAAGKVWGR